MRHPFKSQPHMHRGFIAIDYCCVECEHRNARSDMGRNVSVAHLEEQTFTLRETGRRSSDYTASEVGKPDRRRLPFRAVDHHAEDRVVCVTVRRRTVNHRRTQWAIC
jgi:hypothetical protein